MQNPRQLVLTAFDALKARDYNTLASMCDPLSLCSFKQEMVDEYSPDVPAAEAEPAFAVVELNDEDYAELIEFLDPVRRLQSELPGLSTIEQLVSIDPVSLFATWMYAHSAEHFLDEKQRKPWESGSDWAPHDEKEDRKHELSYVIIGCAFDTPDIAHVLYRNEFSALEAYPEGYGEWFASASPAFRDFMAAMHHRGVPSVITCRRQSDGSWRLVASNHFMRFGLVGVTLAAGEDESG